MPMVLTTRDLVEKLRTALSTQPASAQVVSDKWITEIVGEEVDDLSYGQGYRKGWNDCRAKVIASQPAVPVQEPDYAAEFKAELVAKETQNAS